MTRLRRFALITGGGLVAFTALFLLVEAYLRLLPPDNLRPFLGESAGQRGPYRADQVYGIAYRNPGTFKEENNLRLVELAPLFAEPPGKPVWAFFGNSFVQANGMLADTARVHLKDRAVFNLGQNTPLPIRFAQVQLLLRLGLKPERIFFAIMPVDTLIIGRFPLDTWRVTSGGGLVYEPSFPPGVSRQFMRSSHSALALWVRTGNHFGNPDYVRNDVRAVVVEQLLTDLLRLFGALAEVAHAEGIPVTILLIPDERQIVRGAPFEFQDTLRPHLERLGFDIFDPRAELLAREPRERLFIPDYHYSAAGNEIMFAALMHHLERQGPGAGDE